MRDVESVFNEYLVSSAQAGSVRAMAALFQRWNKKLVAHGWRLTGDAEMAREAAQDTWIEIVRGIASLQDARAFPAWAYRIMSRRCAKQIRALQARRNLIAEAAKEARLNPLDDGSGAEPSKIRAAVLKLAPEQRAAVALFYFEEMSVAEVAVALDVPAGTIKTRLMHARHKLHEALKGDLTCVTSNG
jgi:RNA polymerase sigma-70 factor (ECF subfamily)